MKKNIKTSFKIQKPGSQVEPQNKKFTILVRQILQESREALKCLGDDCKGAKFF